MLSSKRNKLSLRTLYLRELSWDKSFAATGVNCFVSILQILGFDILLTKDLQPKLLEINACPSLSLGHESDENNPMLASVVDEAIKIPLVLDTLKLVMNQSSVEKNSADKSKKRTSVDDTALGKKSSLSEIFPAQYGHSCSPLLVLDRAAYLFLQFVHIRRNMHITMTGFRNMIRYKNCAATSNSMQIFKSLRICVVSLQHYFF